MAAKHPQEELSGAFGELRVTSSSDTDFPAYRMDAVPRGVCVILNNHKFHLESDPDARRLKDRKGTNIDRDKLKATFERLQFEVKCYEDQTHTDILHVIHKTALEDHSRYDCFVCCVLSHGDLGVVYGCNGVPVKIRDLTRPLRPDMCPSLAGKPKLFFLQACQGSQAQEGHADLQPDAADEREKLRLIPNEADFLVSYATVPGYMSWRSETEGTWYIGALTQLLDKHADRRDIGEVLRLVNHDVGERSTKHKEQYKQAPVLMDALRKKLVFTAPGINPLTVSPRRTFSMDSQQLRVPGEEEELGITCLAVTGGGRVVMADDNNKSVKVLDAGSPASISALSLGVKPCRLAVCHDDLVAVTSFSDYVIHLIDVTGTPRVVQQIQTVRQYWGVCCGGAGGTLLVSFRKDGDRRAQLDVITRQGVVVRTVVDSSTLPGLVSPVFLCVVGDQVLLSDFDANCVWRVDVATGSLLAKHTHQELVTPLQVTTDRAGNMYVASFDGQCVLVMGRDGQWRTLLREEEHGEEECVWPFCVALTGTRLFVGWYGGIQSVLSGYELA